MVLFLCPLRTSSRSLFRVSPTQRKILLQAAKRRKCPLVPAISSIQVPWEDLPTNFRKHNLMFKTVSQKF